MNKIILIIAFLICCVSVNAQTSRQVKAVANYCSAWRLKKMSPLFLYLSENLSVGIYSRPIATEIVENIFKKYRQLDTLAVVGWQVKNDGSAFATIKYMFKDSVPFSSMIELDKNGDIVRTELWDQLMGLRKTAISELVASFPIEIKNGSIGIRAKLNGGNTSQFFLFDTGADGMALRTSLADSIGVKADKIQHTQFVGASQQISISRENTFTIDTFQLRHQSIALFDKIDTVFDGIIGAKSLISQYIVKVDMDNKRILLYSFGDSLPYIGTSQKAQLIYKGLPYINGSVKLNSGKNYEGNFVFDTGAGFDLILFSLFVKNNELMEDFTPIGSSTTVSMGHSSPTKFGNIKELDLGALQLQNFQGVLQQYQQGDEEWSHEDGSVGINIIGKYNFTIDLLHKFVYFENRK